MLIALNRAIRRHRGRFGTALSVVALAGAVAIAHSAVSTGHMATVTHHVTMGGDGANSSTPDGGDGGHDMVAMCLAIAETAALGFALLALVSALRCAARISVTALQPALVVTAANHTPASTARAGPAVLQVFLR